MCNCGCGQSKISFPKFKQKNINIATLRMRKSCLVLQRDRGGGGIGGVAESGESQSKHNVTNEQQVLEGSSMEAICSARRHQSTQAVKDRNARTVNSLTPADEVLHVSRAGVLCWVITWPSCCFESCQSWIVTLVKPTSVNRNKRTQSQTRSLRSGWVQKHWIKTSTMFVGVIVTVYFFACVHRRTSLIQR